jgi:preprotein translocase subunit SecF
MLHHERLRPPSHDYPADEWNVIEKAFHPEFLAQLETMSALGNGYLGMRGCPEEGGPNAENGTFINGFYETHPIVYGEEAYGFAKTGQTICSVTDSKIIKLFVDDEPFWLPNAHLLKYDRRLNMKSGTLDREILWETPAGKQVSITSRRLVSFANRHVAAISYQVTLLNAAASLVISSEMAAHEAVADTNRVLGKLEHDRFSGVECEISLRVAVAQVSDQLQAGLLGESTTDFRLSDRLIPIRVRYADSFRGQENDIRQFPILAANKQIVPLQSLATISNVRGQNELLRENQRLMIALTARLEDRDLGSAIEDVKKVLADYKFPVGYTYQIGGQYESQVSSFHDLLFVLGLALAAVFTILVLQFRAFLPALVIISAAPMSLIGVFLLLLITGTPLNVSSFMGIILMVGLVVKNGIILFEYYEKLHGTMSVKDALVEAGKIRLRPILMTTLCTLFGLLPLALGLGSGAELQRPLAIAVIGGLAVSTVITLVVIPVFYSLARQLSSEKRVSTEGRRPGHSIS